MSLSNPTPNFLFLTLSLVYLLVSLSLLSNGYINRSMLKIDYPFGDEPQDQSFRTRFACVLYDSVYKHVKD
jgi:hypothetical protein